ncbi:hypothetical protein GCM10023187_53890 [Nibrella viscosa]|uniref:Uncharacterized protein n=1 Tax=Nibrella viscosa TaxID=1084524 RepID=A0ABP8L132_9BACT
MENGKFKSQILLSSYQLKGKPSTGRIASGYCSYYLYGTMTCTQVPCANARIAASTMDQQCQQCSWTTTSTESYCEGDGSSYFTGQIGQAAYGSGGTLSTIPEGSNLNQVMANLVNTYSSQLTLPEKEYLLDNDEWGIAESLTKALSMWAGYSIQQLEGLASTYLNGEITEEERTLLRNIDGQNYYRIHLMRHMHDGFLATVHTGSNFSGLTNGMNPASCGQCTGNAFKHAILRIMNAATFGRQMSINLGNAHEHYVPRSIASKEILMDYDNNAQGISIFDYYFSDWQNCWFFCRNQLTPTWIQELNQRITNGQLFYIKKNSDPSLQGDEYFDELVTTKVAGESRR